MYSRNLASEQMILVEGEGRKEGRKSFLSSPFLPPFLPSSLHPSIHRSAPTNDRVALKTNNLETIVALKRLSRSSPPSLSLVLALFMHLPALLREAEWDSKRTSMRPTNQCSQEDFLLHYTPQSEEGGREGERRKGWSAHYVVGGRKEGGSEQAAGKPK